MEKEIGKIKKNDFTDIVLRIDDFGGRVGLTIREFVTGDRYTGFTKAGVRILAEDFPKFKELINSVNEEDIKQQSPEELSEEQETLQESIEKEEVKVEKPGEQTKTEKEELPDY
ncbi:hypothetical protein DRN69_01615 [Candidatus Pacearchaeota archaeon]|nr:MAG: hypothetical protein DRN69_01615 [Candidatus Pacearchaeota archaeon]